MSKKTKRNIIICGIIILLYCFTSNYTTALFRSNKYNTYISDDIKLKSPKDVAKNFINLLINNNFNEAYKLLDEKSKNIFKTPDELKEYFTQNYANINKGENGIFIQENYSRVNNEYNIYDYLLVSEKYKSPKVDDPFYNESEFTVFSSITIYEKSPIDYTIEINL